MVQYNGREMPQQRAGREQIRPGFAVVALQLPFELGQPGMYSGLGNTAVVKNGGLEQIVQLRFVPPQELAEFGCHVGDPFPVVDVRYANQIKGVGERIDRFMQIDIVG